MIILALDIATKTGWATEIESGTFDFTLKRGETKGLIPLRFKSKIVELIKLIKADLVAYERPAGRNAHSIILASKMIAHLEEYCLENNIELATYSAKEIKKFFTGNGNSSKEKMIEEAKRRFPEIEIIDDNHADALALLELAKSDLK